MLVFQDMEIYQIADDLSEDEFFEFCVANRDLRIERDPDKKIIIMAPVGSESGFYEGEAFGELRSWNVTSSEGVTLSPSAGFKLPNGATRAADATWISLERWEALTPEQKKKFLPITPDFAIEIRSETDKLKKLKAKMQEWIENGVRLAWLIDPIEQKTHIYRADGSIEILEGFERELSGEGVLKGFIFDLRLLRLP